MYVYTLNNAELPIGESTGQPQSVKEMWQCISFSWKGKINC